MPQQPAGASLTRTGAAGGATVVWQARTPGCSPCSWLPAPRAHHCCLMCLLLPTGVLYAASLWLSNSAYLYLSVSFIQMTKSLMPGLVYASGVLLGTEQYQVLLAGWREGYGWHAGAVSAARCCRHPSLLYTTDVLPRCSARLRPTCYSSPLAWWCVRWGRPT